MQKVLIASLILAILLTILFFAFFFKKSPVVPGTEKFCGGIANLPCPAGFTCKLSGTYPDAGGHCVSN
jgi:hypothetical protein